MYQYGLNNDSNCTTLKQGVNNRKTGGWGRMKVKRYMGTLPSVQFSYNLKTDLKNFLIKKY